MQEKENIGFSWSDLKRKLKIIAIVYFIVILVLAYLLIRYGLPAYLKMQGL